MLDVDRLIPAPLKNDSVESRRQARLLIYAVALACLTSIMASMMMVAIGEPSTAPWVLLTLIPHLAIYLLLRISRSTRLTGHCFLWLLFFEIVFRYGDDGGYSILVVTILPLAAANLINVRAGIIWTCVGVLWAALLGPFLVRPDDYTLGLGLSAAILTIMVGIASTIIELARAEAVREAKESSDRVLQHQQWLRDFAENAFQGIAEVTPDGAFTATGGFETLLGQEKDSLTDENLFSYLHPDNDQLVRNRLALFSTTGFREEVRVRHASGNWVWIEIYGVPQSRQSGSDSFWLIAARDIHSEQLSRERLAQAQRLEGMGVLAAGIAHDFNNLLMVISGFAELLPGGSSRENILVATDEAAALTSNLMAFGKSSPVTNETVEIGNALQQLEPMFRSVVEPGIKLTINYASIPLSVRLPISQLNQILLNLVTNAKEATPRDGAVCIDVSLMDLPEDKARTLGLLAKEYVRITVSDTGSGFAETSLKRAFDPFYSTKDKMKGSGLGLTSAYGIVRQAGGTIDIKSGKRPGATVVVYLPLESSSVAAEAEETGTAPQLNNHGVILLVDDDPKICQLLNALLTQQGFETLVASSAAEALDHVKHSPPALLITDIMMPGMRGTELAEAVRKKHPNLPVLFISGYSDKDVGDWRDSRVQNVRFLAKPFRTNELVTRVNELMNS